MKRNAAMMVLAALGMMVKDIFTDPATMFSQPYRPAAKRSSARVYPFASKRHRNWSDRRAQGGPGLDENNDPRKAI